MISAKMQHANKVKITKVEKLSHLVMLQLSNTCLAARNYVNRLETNSIINCFY